ncbi:hypothetical protein [Kineococcus aurantiacus]|uniref:Uncharacterized protein n=1 Tax=Kineococcus aurantiacus TaxID=37633 RepID=A0A7Y9DQI4_9ACTN|nr:hypothetical protein [Kineococcus aurantiacus]NYD24972.1 hypothetical protein [Kineococcus aurantiacus]
MITIITAGLIAGLSSCARDDASLELTAAREGEIIVASDDGNGSMTAVITGRLARVGPCIGLEDLLVIWPAGTTWDTTTSTLTMPGGHTLTLGEQTELGGGAVPASSLSASSDELAQALTDCNAQPEQDVWLI